MTIRLDAPTGRTTARRLAGRLAAAVALLALLLAPAPGAATTTTNGVFLKGSYVEIGVNNNGYFGVPRAEVPAGYHWHSNGSNGFGFVADYRKNGFTGQYGGDYFTPGSPYEGFYVKWNGTVLKGNDGNGTVGIPGGTLVETSGGTTYSAVWTGTAVNGSDQLKIIQTYSFKAGDLFFTANVQLINVGTTTLNTVRFARSVDPDNDVSWPGGSYTTVNALAFQTPNAENKALVTSTGTVVTDMTIGLGAIDARAKVSASCGSDPDNIINSPQGNNTNDTWVGLGFDIGTLAPGQSASFDYAYILSASDLNTALGALAAVTILQPTGTVSGTSVPFSVTTNDVPNTSRVDFYLNGALIGSSTTPVGGNFSTTFNSTTYANGSLAVKAVATISGTAVEKSSTVVVDNSGPPMSFTSPANGDTVSGTGLTAALSIDALNPPTSVVFYREVAGKPTVTLGTVITAPFQVTYGVADLSAGAAVTIRAVGTNASGKTTNITVGVSVASQVATTLGLALSPSPSTYGQAVTATATVSAPTATGTVQFTLDGAAMGAPVAVSGGAASATLPATLAVGSHAVAATYAGDSNFTGSSASATQVVGKAATTTALAASPSPSTYGQPVTLTATVSSAAAGFTGTVAFTDGGAPIAGCTLQPLSGGTATCALPATLAGGAHAFSAAYAGDASFTGSSGARAHTVNKATPTLLLASSNQASVFGEPITFTATASYGLFTPGGTVTIMDGATVVCGPATLSAGGVASCASQVLAVGTRAVTAVYAGSGDFNGATSAAVNQLVVKGTTTSDVVADKAQAVWGEQVTLTATVYPDAPSVVIPTGTFTFRDSASVICASVPVAADGTATCSTSSLSVAVHAVSARYNGSAGYASSTSFAFAVKVDKASTQPALAASPASTVFGQAVTFTMSALPVAPGAGVPTGTVTLSDGGVAVAGCTARALSGGTVACTTSAFAVGTHSLTVSYAGDGSFVASSGAFSHAVAQASTATTLATSPASPVYGQSITLTSTTTAVAPGAGTRSGAVEFFDGLTSLGSSAVNASGVATLSITLPAAGGHAFTATSSGDGSFLGSTSASVPVTVGKVVPSLALTTSGSPTTYGSPATFTATLDGPEGAPLPSGTVTFSEGATTLCTAGVVSGVATCSRSSFLPGSHTVHAAYAGDVSYLAAAADVVQSVSKASPGVSLVALPTPSVFGQEVTLAVAVSGLGLAPAGTVSITDAGTPVCGPVALDASGHAQCLTAALQVDDHALAVSYGGDANYLAAEGVALHTVDRALTDTTLALSSAATVFGEPVTLTATVTAVAPGAGLPSGVVDFLDGETLLGSAEVDFVTGQAVFITGPLAVGDHALSASYAGDFSFQGSITLDAQPLTVSQAATAVAVASSVNPSVFGQGVDLTFDVTAVAPGAGTPAGQVSVVVDGGEAVLLDLSAGRAVLSRADLEVASHLVEVTYLGDASFLPASGAHTQVVNQAASATELTASAAATVFGEQVTFTATVTTVAPGAGLPVGSVAFADNGTALATVALDASGVATFTTGALQVGSHAISASYLGDGHFTASADEIVGDVTLATSALALSVSSAAPAFGAPVTLTASAAAVAPGAGIPTGSVTFLDGSVALATVPLTGGVATVTTSSFAPGLHDLTATYGGDEGFLPAVSEPASTDVQPAPVSVALALTAATTAFGEPFGYAVQVSANGGSTATPDGSVELYDGAALLATLALDAEGKAGGTLSSLAAGPHALQAIFVANLRFMGGASELQAHTVLRGSTSLTLASSLPTSTFGDGVTFSATVAVLAPAAGTPTGLVTFSDGATVLGSAAVDASGLATLATAALHAGDHAISAAYAGDPSFEPSGAGFTQVVQKASSSGATVATPASSVFGQAVAFEVTVTSPAGTPSGLVTFQDGAAVLGTATLDAAGKASLSSSALAVGSHAVTVAYAGDADHLAAEAPAVTSEVKKASTATTVAATPAGAVFGQAVTLTATTAAVAPGAGAPGGTVAFRDGETAIAGCEAVALTAGTATCSTSALSAASHTLSAAYAGDGSFLGSTSGSLTFAVGKAAVTVVATAAPTAPVFGEPVTLAITVAAVAPGAGTPGGTASIRDGATDLGSATLAGGTATFTTNAPLAVGPHTLFVGYGGDASFQARTAPVTITVARSATSATLAAAPAEAVAGQPVRLTAAFAPVAPGAGALSGAATFRDGATVLATVPLDGAGQAVLEVTTLGVGAHALTATYAGDTSFAAATAATGLTVGRGNAALRLAAAPDPAVYGQPVTVSVTLDSVAPATGVPEGQVIVRDGDAVLCSGQAAGGAFSCPLARPAVGRHDLTASFDGGAQFGPAAGSGTLTVEASPASLTVASSRNPSRRGRDVVFTATASAEHATPDGTVTFLADGVALGTATLVDGVASFTTRDLVKKASPYDVTADYAGSADFSPASASLEGGQVVENSPPVAGAGTALALGPAAARSAVIHLGGLLDAGDLTLEAWARAAWTSTEEVSAAPTVLSVGSGDAVRLSLGLSADRSKVTFSAAGTSRSVAAPVDDQAWHHLALVSHAGSVALYVDGLLADSVEATLAGAGDDLTLGAGFAGEVDEVRAWTVARSAADLAAGARRTVSLPAGGLAGYWRMDEGTGAELFDAASTHDGAVTLAAEGASAFAASTTWRHHEVKQERSLSPAVDAGYDVDGDDLTVSIAQAALHGTASADQPHLQAAYLAGPGFLGTDSFTFALSDGEASSSYELELTVSRILTCQASADCGGGDVCLQGVCAAPGSADAAASGCGCTTGAGPASALWAFLALGLLGRRRRRAA